MKKVGVTGSNGFIGYHLLQSLSLLATEYSCVHFERTYFGNQKRLDEFVKECDVIVHLAALNRHEDQETIYKTNTWLVSKLIESLERVGKNAHVLISSSSQEERNNPYGKSKKEGRLLLSKWARDSGGCFTGLIIPNVYGPFGRPNFNSVVATFCHMISHGETPEIQVDNSLKLIYVGDLVNRIIRSIREKENNEEVILQHTIEIKVSEIFAKLQEFKATYQDGGEVPILNNDFEYKLFNTYRCYMDIQNYFPRKFTKYIDNRGAFVEIIRAGIGGQMSFSTTVPGITRGNHFHTRKIERFAVIKGKALVQLRRIGTDEVLEFYLDGKEPAYVDMPIWYTHNIKNIGENLLYTNFWINEPYNPLDPDTWIEEVLTSIDK